MLQFLYSYFRLTQIVTDFTQLFHTPLFNSSLQRILEIKVRCWDTSVRTFKYNFTPEWSLLREFSDVFNIFPSHKAQMFLKNDNTKKSLIIHGPY
jgi:hypothetical protein